MLPLVRTFVSLVAGIGEMAVVPFAIFTLIGTAVVLGRGRLGRLRPRFGVAQAGQGASPRRGSSCSGLAVVAIVVFIWHRWRVVKGEH